MTGHTIARRRHSQQAWVWGLPLLAAAAATHQHLQLPQHVAAARVLLLAADEAACMGIWPVCVHFSGTNLAAVGSATLLACPATARAAACQLSKRCLP
jgi:hypothetical protein